MPPLSEPESFDAIEYLRFLRTRWKLPAAATALAATIAVAACLLLPKEYTATATVVIEPPGTDPRAAIAVSPIYLESLKSYETLASSDSLFAKAVEKFHLLEGGGATLEAFKRRVLRVEKMKETKVLQISVTLPDPKEAQAVVEFLTNETVALSAKLARNGDRDFVADAEQKLTAATTRLEKARAEAAAAEAAGSEAILENEAKALADVQARIQTERIEANSMVAESIARGDQTSAAEARARLNAVTADLSNLQKQLDAKSVTLAGLRARQQRAADELKTAQADFDVAHKREDEVINTARFRTEQLHIVDPGIIPERPSFPNLPLAVASAIVLSMVTSLVWLTLQFGFAARREQPSRTNLRVAGGAGR